MLDSKPGFSGLGKDNCKTRRKTLSFGVWMYLILEFDSIFQWYVSEVSVPSHYVIYFICIPGKLFFVSIITVQSIMCAHYWVHTILFCTLQYLIIINMQTYLKALNISNACKVYSVKYVFEKVHSFNHLLCNIWDCVFSAFPVLFWWFWDYLYLLLLSSNQKHESIVIVQG